MRQLLYTFAVPGIRIFFTSKRAGLTGDVTSRLVDFVAATQRSIDCAIYDLRDLEVLAALRRKMREGCRVRVAFDAGEPEKLKPGADPKPNGTEAALDEFGLLQHSRKIRRTSKTYLHHKFLIRDRKSIWTGTGNFTTGALQLQDNNWIVVHSQQLARRYGQAFDLIWAEPTQALALPIALSRRRIGDVPGAWLWPFFEPTAGTKVENAIASALGRATKVRMMAFELSDPEIGEALTRFADPGADIRGIFDVNGMKDALAFVKSPDPRLYWWYLGDQRFVGVRSHPFMTLPGGLNDFHHLKTFILDDHTVITGSYNFSTSAETNNEDVLFIRSPAVAGAYRRYFRRLFVHYSTSGGV